MPFSNSFPDLNPSCRRSLSQNRVTGHFYISEAGTCIRHFRNEKGSGAEMCPAIVSGIVTGNSPVSSWLLANFQFSPILSNRLVTADPEVFVKVHSV